ncbi:hypothetical protein [Tardiphaga sp.]|jgi:hypothetical protein|uniref:hypothetical protein n=1 Tax=Tardiphaga sp. TaxID=1926292 RepID=UPI0037DA5D44
MDQLDLFDEDESLSQRLRKRYALLAAWLFAATESKRRPDFPTKRASGTVSESAAFPQCADFER